MPKITISREDTQENMIALAIAKGYTTKIKEIQQVPKTVYEPVINWDGNYEFDAEGRVVIEEKEIMVDREVEIDNPETPINFISRFYQEIIDWDITSTFVDIRKKQLAQARAAEDDLLTVQVKTAVWNSSIIIE